MNDDFPLFRRKKTAAAATTTDVLDSNSNSSDDDDDSDNIFSTHSKRRGNGKVGGSPAVENLNLDDILKDIDNEFFTDDAEKILDTERKHKKMSSIIKLDDDDDDDLFGDLEGKEGKSGAEDTYYNYDLLEQLKGITGYKESNLGSTGGTVRQGPSNTMNSILWGDAQSQQEQQQQQQQSLEDIARELEKTFALSDNEEDSIINAKSESASRVSDDEEEEDDGDELGASISTSTSATPEEKGVSAVASVASDEDTENIEVPIKTPRDYNANLLELNLVSDDGDDTDELFLSKRATAAADKLDTTNKGIKEGKEGAEEEAATIDGMTRMTAGEDPLSKPKLTAQSALRRSVATITPVSVPLSMTPLGAFTPSDAAKCSTPKKAAATGGGGGGGAGGKKEEDNGNKEDEKSGKIEGVKFFRTAASPLPQEWENKRKKVLTRLKKYQVRLENDGLRQQKDMDALEEELRQMQAQLTEDLRKYASWHKPHLVRVFRKYVQLRLGLFAVLKSIAADKSVLLMKKLGDVRALRQEAGLVFSVDPSFYTDPLAAAPSPRDERLLRILTNGVRALGPRVKRLVLESSRVFSYSERRSGLYRVLDSIPADALKGGFFAPDYDAQAEFDSWLLDARTREGQQVAHFCSTVAESSGKPVAADDIVLFIDEFVGHIIATYQVTAPADGAKLALLVQRALFPRIYEDALRLAPAPPLRARDLPLLQRLERLREERHPGIQIDDVFWAGKVDPLVDAEKVLTYLPFQLAPPDMIYVLQKTVTAICQVGKSVLHHNLAADEIVPLFVHTIVYAAPPGLHEALFMMEYLSQDVDRTGESGWCIAAFETALNHIEDIKLQ